VRYEYECSACGTINELDVMLSDKPADWQPPKSVHCQQCQSEAKRSYGCVIGVQNNSDETKHIGKSTSSTSNFQFLGEGFPDVDRKLEAEQKEIDELMDEPPTREEMDAGRQQMEELERDLGKPKGAISGDREMEEVELVGVSADEARRVDADAQQRLDGVIDQAVAKHADAGFVSPTRAARRRVSIAAGDHAAAKEYKLNQPLEEGQKTVAKIAKRRGKEKLKSEMESNRVNRQ
jgi:predicted nucleic acid-binding Zn ribbon protein